MIWDLYIPFYYYEQHFSINSKNKDNFLFPSVDGQYFQGKNDLWLKVEFHVLANIFVHALARSYKSVYFFLFSHQYLTKMMSILTDLKAFEIYLLIKWKCNKSLFMWIVTKWIFSINRYLDFFFPSIIEFELCLDADN